MKRVLRRFISLKDEKTDSSTDSPTEADYAIKNQKKKSNYRFKILLCKC